MQRGFCLLISMLLLLSLLPAAQAAGSPEEQLRSLLEEYGLPEEQLSLSYYNMGTGESYEQNPDALHPAGALWMLPLHMYYCEQESLGAFEAEKTYPEEEFTINEYTLAQCRYRTLLLEDEDLAIAMRERLGSYSAFKRAANEAFGHLPPEMVTEEFLTENRFSVRFWMACLQELNLRSEIYQDLSRNYALIQPADALTEGAQGQLLFQIRGEEDGYVTVLGRVGATHAFLIACSLPSEKEELLSRLCELFREYTENGELPIAQTETGKKPSDDMLVTAQPQTRVKEMLLWIGTALGGALVLALLIAGLLRLRRRQNADEDDLDE